MKRIMAIDYGDARTGIAISDLLCSLVGSTTVIHSRVPEKTVAEICRLPGEPGGGPGHGFPGIGRHRGASGGAVPGLCLAAGGGLRPDGSPVGRARTTIEAHQILSDHNYHGKKRKNTVDAVAASLILEGYLSFRCR